MDIAGSLRRSRVAAPDRLPYRDRMADDRQFWFNVDTGQVEEDSGKGRAENLLGPYPTREAAAAALETARARTESWDEEDRKWREGK